LEERCLTSCKLNALTKKVESCGFPRVDGDFNDEGTIIKSDLTSISRGSSVA
jgi:hypothetical protein